MKVGTRIIDAVGSRQATKDAIHRFLNFSDSSSDPFGVISSHSIKTAPRLFEIVAPRLWQPARRANIIASMPRGQSKLMITVLGIQSHVPRTVWKADDPSTNRWSLMPSRLLRRR